MQTINENETDPCSEDGETYFCQARSRSNHFFGEFVNANSTEEAKQKFWEKHGVRPHWASLSKE